LGTDKVTASLSATGTGIIDYEIVFLAFNIVAGTKVLTKAQAEATFNFVSTASPTAPNFNFPYDGPPPFTGGPGAAFACAGPASQRTTQTSGVRVRARNATGYSAATFSVGTGQIVDTGG
jgi:hypothetical protein